jgi:hypothetical protein
LELGEILLFCGQAFVKVVGRRLLVAAEKRFHPGVKPCLAVLSAVCLWVRRGGGSEKIGFRDFAKKMLGNLGEPVAGCSFTTNCTTSIRSQHDAKDRAPWDWRILANGKADELLYERGHLDRTLSFAELKRRARINEHAKAIKNASDFSERIRTDITSAPAQD